MNSNYKRNKAAAIFNSNKPTKTDQSQASTTDINVIVTQFLRTGHSPGQQQPIYGDFTEFPPDLQTMFQLASSVKEDRSTANRTPGTAARTARAIDAGRHQHHTR